MTTSLSTQPTTPVSLGGLSMDAYRGIVAQLQAQHPTERERIGRGLTVLLGSRILETARSGQYLVQSCQDGGTYYLASSFACCCPDAAHRALQGRCKHVFACIILSCASAIARREHLTAQRRSLVARVSADERDSITEMLWASEAVWGHTYASVFAALGIAPRLRLVRQYVA